MINGQIVVSNLFDPSKKPRLSVADEAMLALASLSKPAGAGEEEMEVKMMDYINKSGKSIEQFLQDWKVKRFSIIYYY